MDAMLEVEKRQGHGKNEARRLRASGRIPAVVYGSRKGKASDVVQVAVDPKAVMRILHSESGANTLITLKLGGSESRVMVKEYQHDACGHPAASLRWCMAVARARRRTSYRLPSIRRL
jgi:ribosomal protein L25 (general stress protein Ctc)